MFTGIFSRAFACAGLLALNAGTQAANAEAVEEIVVTASPLAGNPDEFATIVGTVNRDDIVRNGGASLADALAGLPGVTGSGFASGASRPVIRGFDANRVRILENGVGSFDVSDVGPDHGVPIDPLSTQDIEVIRGAATLRYGSQAIGGVVNAINGRVPLALSDKPVSADVTGTYGTNADTRQGSALIDGRVGQLGLHADGFVRHTGDYAIPGGTLENSFFRGAGFSFGSSYFLDDLRRIGAAVVHYQSEYGIPGEAAFIDMKQTKGLFGSSFAVDARGLKTINIDGGYADYTHSEVEPAVGPASTFNDHEWDARAEALFDAVGPFSAAALGMQFQHRDFAALGEGADYLLPARTKTAAGFAFAERMLNDRAKLQIGARVERVSVKGTPVSDLFTSRHFTPISGSAGLLFDASGAVTLGLTLSSAARAPAQTELYSRGPHDGPLTFEIGDPSLRMERANSLEGTVRFRDARMQFDGAVWGVQYDNFIFGRLTGQTCDDTGACAPGATAELKEMFYAAADANFWGVEGKLTFDLSEIAGAALSAEFIGDFVRAKFDGGGNVPRIPPFHAGAGLAWGNDVVDAGIIVKYTGRQADVSTVETPTRAYVSLDAQAAWHPLRLEPEIEVALVGRNLTNTTQRNAVALNKDEVILPGRDVRLVLRAAF